MKFRGPCSRGDNRNRRAPDAAVSAGAASPREAEEDEAASSSSKEEVEPGPVEARPQRQLRQRAKGKSDMADPVTINEGVLADAGSNDDADVDWEDA